MKMIENSYYTLKRLELLEIALPQIEPFRSAIGLRTERRALIIRWIDQDGNQGIGECSCRPDPFFNGEFVEGAISIIRDFIFPQLKQQSTLSEITDIFKRIRNWPFTVAAVEAALLDLQRRGGKGDPLDHWQGPRLTKIPVGISLGMFETPEAAVERVAAAISDGYHRIKLKIAPSVNLSTLAAIREAFPDQHIAFDANGSLGINDFELLQKLAELRPSAIEQPFAPADLHLCQKLKQYLPELRICLDESVAAMGNLFSAHRLNAIDELNIKPGRVGGMLTALEMVRFCKSRQIPVWVGGMFETGIGRIANLRLAALLTDATAHDLSPSSRYFTDDLVMNPVDMDPDGFIDIADERPVTLNDANIERFIQQRIVLTKD